MITQYIEALIFASDTSLRIEEIIVCLQAALEQDFDKEEVMAESESVGKSR